MSPSENATRAAEAHPPVPEPFMRPVRGTLMRWLSRQLRCVCVAGMECTGSTFVYQIMRGMGFRVQKTHAYTPGWRLKLVTYRDPRDVICSHARRQFAEQTERDGLEAGLLSSHARLFREWRRHEDVLRYFEEKKAVLIRYESFFDGKEAVLADKLASLLAIRLTGARRDELCRTFSIEANQARAEGLQSFDEYNPETQVHGHHISSGGRVGVWREIFTPRVREAVKQDLAAFLVRFGYEHGTDW